MQSQNEQLDPAVINMAKSIRQVESGGNYQARGKSREYGAYQYTPETWKADSQKYLGRDVELESSTREEQNEVAYKKIKELKDRGLNVGQVASVWNSGDPEAYLGTFTTGKMKGMPSSSKSLGGKPNPFGVDYDVPAYARTVAQTYQQYKAGINQPIGIPSTPSTVEGAQVPEQEQALSEEGLGKKLENRAKKVGSTFLEGMQRAEKGGSLQEVVGGGTLAGLTVLGEIAGGAGDVLNAGLRLIPGFRHLEDWLGGAAGEALKTPAGQSVVKAMSDFSREHPQLSQAASETLNIVTAIPILKTASAVASPMFRSLAEKGLVNTIKQAGIEDAESVAKTFVDEEIVPDLKGKVVSIPKSMINKLKRSLAGYEKELADLSSGRKSFAKYTSPGEFESRVKALEEIIDLRVKALNALQEIDGAEVVKGVLQRAIELPKKALKMAAHGAAHTVKSSLPFGVGAGLYETYKHLFGN